MYKLILILDDIQLDNSPSDFSLPQKIEYSDLIICCTTLKNYKRNFLAKSLHENLLKYSEHSHFHEILFEVNKSVKQIVESTKGHQQAIEYIEINMSRMNLYFMKAREKFDKKIKLNESKKSLEEFSIYKMASETLGFCIILNMIKSEENDEMTILTEAFNNLNFKVKIFQDLNNFEIKENLNELLNSEECDLHDCIVLYIRSHDRHNGFITANFNYMEYHEIFEMFSNAKCRKFIGKPKLLFFDCCKGDHSKMIRSACETLPNMFLYSDLFVCYSTLKCKLSIHK